MFEATANPRAAEALRKAHTERAAAFTSLFRIFSLPETVPLSQQALTEPSR